MAGPCSTHPNMHYCHRPLKSEPSIALLPTVLHCSYSIVLLPTEMAAGARMKTADAGLPLLPSPLAASPSSSNAVSALAICTHARAEPEEITSSPLT
jgi:hypothetical protein